MTQTWNDLLFAHWPVSFDHLRPLVPRELPLDVFNGQCWVGVVPFYMTNVRPRAVPPLPLLSQFAELNVRTYVTLNNQPGVYFFSLDAASLPAVWGARTFYHLPYFYAVMQVRGEQGRVFYQSRRRGGNADLQATYAAVSDVRQPALGTLDHWLTERYCLYTVYRGRIFRCDIHHRPWPLQDAEATIALNTMHTAAKISLPSSPPLLHFSAKQEVLIWPICRVNEVRPL